MEGEDITPVTSPSRQCDGNYNDLGLASNAESTIISTLFGPSSTRPPSDDVQRPIEEDETLSLFPETPSVYPPISSRIDHGSAHDVSSTILPGPTFIAPLPVPSLDDAGAALHQNQAVPSLEKDGDNPTSPPHHLRDGHRVSRHATPTALTRLLASTAADSPVQSRSTSYANGNPNLVRQISARGASSLHDHLYTRGLLGGKHSDITIIAFGHKYDLHRLILDRAPFFSKALSPPWLESTAREVVLHPEDIDPTITQKAFELTLKRLYGCDIRYEEDAEAVGLFATGCWLEMHDIVDSAIESILRQMEPETLSPLIRLVTTNYYGRAGERILASAKAMLCRDGWEMATRLWDDVPGEIVREIVGGDGFYVAGEWERWSLARRLLDRRLRQKAVEYELVTNTSRTIAIQAPETLRRTAIRTNMKSDQADLSAGLNIHDQWLALYSDADIEPMLVLLDHGIHYVHLDFEHLQYIRTATDVYGVPYLSSESVMNAMWKQLELRQRVTNAREQDLELGLAEIAEEQTLQATKSAAVGDKGKQRAPNSIQVSSATVSSSNKTRPRRFRVPHADCNIVMGGNSEPVITTSTSSTFLRLSAGVSAHLDATDMDWAAGSISKTPHDASAFIGLGGRSQDTDQEKTDASPVPAMHSNFPPFRFAAEFPHARSLKEKKRVYSRTVFYAGSHWNIYIQRVRSQKNPQLGVYLHRARERESPDAETISNHLSSRTSGTVDEHISLLEREMRFRSASTGQRIGDHRSTSTQTREPGNSITSVGNDDGSMAAYRRSMYGASPPVPVVDTSFTAFDSDSDSASGPSSGDDNPTTGDNFLDTSVINNSATPGLTHFPPPGSSSNSDQRNSAQSPTSIGVKPRHNPTLPPYVDARPTIKTYFKIYSPSKGGRLLSVYESAPDKFDFSQSWGWKSSTLMLDEGFSSSDLPSLTVGEQEQEGEEVQVGKKKRDGALRFMVVIGNL